MILTDDEARRIMGVAGALGLALGLGVTSCADRAEITGPEMRSGTTVDRAVAVAGTPERIPETGTGTEEGRPR